MANTTGRLYLLHPHMNYKVVTSNQDFCADTFNVLKNAFLSLTQAAAEGLLCSILLREAANLCFHPQLKNNKSIWEELSSWAWFAPSSISALHQLLEQPHEKSTKQTNKKWPFSCCCLHFICKVKKIVTSYQCKMPVNPWRDLQLYRCYHRPLNSYWSKTPPGEKPRIIVTTRKYISI